MTILLLQRKKANYMQKVCMAVNWRTGRRAAYALFCVLALLTVAACAPKTHKADSSPTSQAAEQAARENKLEKAVELYEQALKENPDSGLINYHLGYTYGLMGNKAKEVELYQKAVDLGYEDGTLYYNLGMAYGERGDLDKAEAVFKKALERDANNADAHFGLAIIYESSQRTAEAEKAYLEAIRSDAKHLDAYIRLSLLYEQDQQHDKAKATLQKLLQIEPAYPPALQLQQVLEKSGDKTKAE